MSADIFRVTIKRSEIFKVMSKECSQTFPRPDYLCLLDHFAFNKMMVQHNDERKLFLYISLALGTYVLNIFAKLCDESKMNVKVKVSSSLVLLVFQGIPRITNND